VHVASVAFGFLIGLSLGLLGGGGSILTVPIFVYVLGFGAKESIAMSLAVVGVTSLVGAAAHWRQGHVQIRVALLFGIVAMLGSYVGTRLATRLTGTQQLVIFAGMMVVAATIMLRGRRTDVEPGGAGSSAGRPPSLSMAVIAAQGFVVGSLTGLIGIGGGFLIVPVLIWGGLAMREAVGTSLVAIAMNCAVGFFSYLGQVQIAWIPMALVTAGTVPGIATGTHVMRFVSQDVLRRAFAVLLFGLAAYMLYGSLPGFLASR
jgi:uncharacterized protein